MPRLLALLVFVALPLRAADLAEYAGRYQQSDGNAVVVWIRDGELTARPLFWRATQQLVADGPDTFHSAERPERKASFGRDASGRVASLTMNGIGHDAPMPRVTSTRALPAELLMGGRPREAARGLLERSDAREIAKKWGDFIVQSLPTKAADGAAFLAAIVKRFPDDLALRKTYAELLVAAGRRTEAKKEFARAGATDSVCMLSSDDLGPLFAKPSRTEIDAVRARWAGRDLAPRDVEVVHRAEMSLGHTTAEVRVVAHLVQGSRHYGAVIVPRGAANAPVVVEAKGVSPSYFPLDLSRIPYAPAVLAAEQHRFVYFLPSYRGEVLKVDGRTWTSEGDRTDVWDGATDDFLAFTAAALTVTPEADPKRITAFGKSRGGTVAMLAGIRDPRFTAVVAWSGPTDHFFEMVQSGWTPRERAAEGLRRNSDVFGIGGQFLETFLAKKRTVAETRVHLLASSPLWFADRLPPRTQVHYGLDDNMVAARNGRALIARNPRIQAFFHEEAGHDLDKRIAFRETRRFLLSPAYTSMPTLRMRASAFDFVTTPGRMR